MATFWERVAYSVYRMFSLYFDLYSGFEGGTLVLIAPVLGLCLLFSFSFSFSGESDSIRLLFTVVWPCVLSIKL